MAGKFELRNHYLDQWQVFYWGTYVAICGDKEGMPVNFLFPRTCKVTLTEEERAELIAFVWRTIGPVMRGKQTEKAWHDAQRLLDAGRNPVNQ